MAENAGAGREDLPIVVIGAGPTGLAAAAHLSAKGQRFIVLEAGVGVGAHVDEWGHVQVFSPWRFNVDRASAALLEAAGWVRPPDEVHPIGKEFVEQYLQPLAALPAIEPHLRLRARVLAVQGQLSAAIVQFERAIRLNPQYADAQEHLTKVLLLRNRRP